MRKLVLLLMVLGLSVFAVAQNGNPKVEIFGGYALERFDFGVVNDLTEVPGLFQHETMHGWAASATFNANKYFGVVADFSGHYKTFDVAELPGIALKPRVYNIMFGPQVGVPIGKVKPFARALFGFTHATAEAEVLGVSESVSANKFAFGFGGGLDVNFTNHFGIRLAQLDYIRNSFDLSSFDSISGTAPERHQNNLRFAAGLKINF